MPRTSGDAETIISRWRAHPFTALQKPGVADDRSGSESEVGRLTEAISGLPPTTDIAAVIALVGFGPLSDSCSAAKGRLFDHLVRTAEYRDRHADAQRLGSLEIDHQFDLSGLLDWQVRRLFAFQNATSVDTGQAIGF